jgi:hypothetical protein
MPVCSFPGCVRSALCRGLCNYHYRQLVAGRPLTPALGRRVRPWCSFPGCSRKASGKGLCFSHRLQQRRGLSLTPLKKTRSRALVSAPGHDTALLVPLTKGQFAVVDASDRPVVERFLWQLDASHGNSFYARTTFRGSDGKRSHVSLHRLLWKHWGMPDAPEIDHRNMNGLDCRRENLRAADAHGNNCNKGLQKNNKTGVKGVSWSEKHGKWHAQIGHHRRKVHLGFFADIKEATRARAEAERHLHGSFARRA